MQNKINTVIQKKRLRKKLLFLVLPVLFFAFTSEVAHAGVLGWHTVGLAFKALLYGVFEFVGLFTSIAITLFAYVVDPQYISGDSGLLNLQAVYDMWKFVRDFINIFFILGLLFIAFAFVFQIDSYSNSKSIIKLVIAALLVNFSFPIARLIIDLANVPMYFFLQMIVGDNGGTAVALSSSLSASNLDKILLPESLRNTDVSTILAAIVFLFIFNITIFVFAFQFLIRLIALIILVILSPIGFVAGGIPGLKKYGSQWWDNFLKYCFFGPAAIFMLLLATNFFAAISNTSSSSPYGGVSQLASSTSADPGMIASMVLFFIPITMLWFAMGISSKFSVAGASVATKYGKDFAKWAGKKAASPVTTRYQGIKKGVSKGLQKGQLGNWEYRNAKVGFGKYKYNVGRLATGQHWDDRTDDTKAFYAGAISGGTRGIQREKEKAEDRRLHEKMKEFKDDNLSRDALEEKLKKGTDIEKKAAALSLAESKDGIKKRPEVLAAALQAVAGDYEKFEKVLKSADDDAISMKPQQFFDSQVAGMQTLLASKGVTDFAPANKKELDDTMSKIARRQKLVEDAVNKAAASGITGDDLDKAREEAEGKFGLTDRHKAIAETGNKMTIDFGKQIKKTGGDIDKLFEYQSNKPLATMSSDEIAGLYNQHKLTMKDLSQQSALLKNANFQEYAQSNFTLTEVTELTKMVVQNNKNPEVRVQVEGMKNAVDTREKKRRGPTGGSVS